MYPGFCRYLQDFYVLMADEARRVHRPPAVSLAVSSVRACAGLLAGTAGALPLPHGQNVLHHAAPASDKSSEVHPTSIQLNGIQLQV